MNEIKLFGRWDTSQIQVNDVGLRDYINLDQVYIPKRCGRNASNRFWKSKYNIIERLINKMMVPGHRGKKHKITSGKCTGKYNTVYCLIIKSFDIIEKKRIERCLADEIMKAYRCDQGSQAITKKLELERQADSSR